MIAENGNPSITLRSDEIDVVLPVAVLDEAHRQGYASSDAVLAFLRRYGSCSDLLDLNVAHAKLTVRLFVKQKRSLEESIVAHGDEILAWSWRDDSNDPDASRRLTNIFEISPTFETIMLDYTPGERSKHCIAPDQSN